ncbi:hypothetical protein [Bacillus mycoides]|uniref:Transposase n=1 Tax=Bacillus mycoides (strain KBAB4) TaxID=315730 RepID=A9VVR7_BACMK|nr:hypothetical protein [Bacillus mycoides]ABY46882.1 hypothetical protein BcerKBAB4_5831 [Bacillus mycoides KBAB4]
MKIEFKVKLEISGLNGIQERLFWIVTEETFRTIVQELMQAYLGL